MTDERFIQYETDGAIATVTLDRPGARNAQHPPFLEQFDAALRPTVRSASSS